MRTTLNLDDDVLQKVKDYAESRSLSVGRAVSELVRKGAVHSHSYPDCERNPSLRHSRRFPMYYGKKSEGTRIRTRMTVFLLRRKCADRPFLARPRVPRACAALVCSKCRSGMGHLSFHTGRVRADLVKSRFFTSRGFAAGGAPFVEHQSEASRAPLWGG